MLYSLEFLGDCAAHPLGGRIWQPKFGELLLQMDKFFHQPVKLLVRNLCPALLIIQVRMVVDLIGKIGDSLSGFGFGHFVWLLAFGYWLQATGQIHGHYGYQSGGLCSQPVGSKAYFSESFALRCRSFFFRKIAFRPH